MAEKYYTILTKTGQAKIANALAYGRKLSLTQFALGDGNGASYDPDENQTALRHEVYRAAVANVIMSDESIGMLEINMAVPADIGGFTVREMGIFDDAGDLIAIAKTPDDPKPTAASGAAKDVVYRLFIIVSNAEVIEIKIDPTVAVATKAEVEAVREELKIAKIDITQMITTEVQPMREELTTMINAKLAAHDGQVDAHSGMQNSLTQLQAKIIRLEDMILNDITGNPYVITFEDLDGISIEEGVWNSKLQRIEF